MLPDRVSNPGPLTYESGALPIALRGPACIRLNDGPNIKLVKLFFYLVGAGLSLVWCLIIKGETGGFYCSGISVVLLGTPGISRAQLFKASLA